ncbi:MAG TPA: hypothetical protein ENG42_00325 [Candidatus Aenigmarchaeota archaeon]|nr:MAG: hypothetical protein DRP03_03550 [Candidatus Aenigmarchaeota archaeon]HDD45896.1 hypothetical protein [Candidatus Aenigmarchaeota archaeon]
MKEKITKNKTKARMRKFKRKEKKSAWLLFLKKYKLHVLILVILLISIAIVLVVRQPTATSPYNPIMPAKSIEIGDIVTVAYKTMYENETVIESGNFTFVAGRGYVIKGIDNAVIGMKEGEKKRILVTPEEGYGTYDEKKIIYYPLVRKINRTLPISLQDFEDFFNSTPIVGETYQASGMPWPIRVLNVTDNTVIVSHEPEDNISINQSYGVEIVRKTDKNIIVTLIPRIGARIQTYLGIMTVKSANSTHIALDLNHPFAGKTLLFDIKVLSIEKYNKTAESKRI